MHQKLIEALKEHAEWAHANEWETPITLSDDLDEAVRVIEKVVDPTVCVECDNKTMAVKLSKSQCENLIEIVELNLFDQIRKDAEIDNVEWLCDIVDAYRALKEAAT